MKKLVSWIYDSEVSKIDAILAVGFVLTVVAMSFGVI